MDISLDNGSIWRVSDDGKCKLTTTGNVIRLQYLRYRPEECPILVLPDNQYCLKSTGEVLGRQKKATSRASNLNYVRRSMARMRDYINTNVVDANNTIWVTFTYVENMRDAKKLYFDFGNFNSEYRKRVGHYEYIAVAEPQARGAWHLHVFFIFEDKPYIDYNLIRHVWGHGRVEVQHMYGDIDNLGAYLSAYLSNYDLREIAENAGNKHDLNIIQRVTHDGDTKSFIKGMRLSMYPPEFNMCRPSRGIKKPVEELMSIEDAKKKVSSGKLTYKKAVEIADEKHNYSNLVYTEYYNTGISESQETN